MSKILEIIIDLWYMLPDKSESKFIPIATILFVVGLFMLLIRWTLRYA